MAMSSGLSHVAMSVPEGTLTDEYRAQLLEFYGRECAVAPLEQVVIRTWCVLLEHERSSSLHLVCVLDHPSLSRKNDSLDLDLHCRVGERVPYPVRRTPAAGQQVEGLTVGGVPDLDAVRSARSANLRRHVAVVVGGHIVIVSRDAPAARARGPTAQGVRTKAGASGGRLAGHARRWRRHR